MGFTDPAEAAPNKIGRIDRYWAAWEGFDPEAYVMMKSMGERFAKMQSAASIARDSGDESELTRSAREQLTDQVVDWATDLNPAVKPVKALSDFAMDGTQRWLDWSFRYEVNQMYLQYKVAFEKTGDVKLAADTVSRWLDEESETASLAMKEKELTVLRKNRAWMIASIIDNHQRHDPAKYEGKDIARALRTGARPSKANDPSKPANKTPSKPAGADQPAPSNENQNAPVTPAMRQAVLDCMCKCNSTANQSAVGVRYDPAPNNASPDCSQPSKGACVNQGFGCWRHVPPTSGTCVDACFKRNGAAAGSVRP